MKQLFVKSRLTRIVCAAAFLCGAYVQAQDITIDVNKELDEVGVPGDYVDVSSGAFTVAARVKLLEPGTKTGNDGVKNGMIVSCASGWTNGFRIYYDWNNRGVYFNVGQEDGAKGCGSNFPVAPNLTHDIIATYDGTAKKIALYVDGMKAGESAFDGTPIVGSHDFLTVGYVGFGIGSNKMHAEKAEYWTRVLTSEEIAAHNSANRSASELAELYAANRATTANVNSANVAPFNWSEALKLGLPDDLNETLKREWRAKLILDEDYAQAAPLVFQEANALMQKAYDKKIDETQEVSNAELSAYGELLEQLKAIEKNSRANEKEAGEVRKALELACPRETAVFKKIDALEKSADRVRQIEKDALQTFHKMEKQLKVAHERVMIYVSPTGNDVSGVGSKSNPFASLARACDEAAKYKNVRKAVVVEMAGGVYHVEKTAFLQGAERVWIKPAKGAEVELTGGQKINNFKTLADAANASALVASSVNRFREDVRDKIFAANLREAGVKDFGKMNVRGYGAANDVVACVPSLYLDGESQTPARWPNEGEEELKFGEKVEQGEDATTSTFKYDFDRPDGWADLDSVWAFGLYQWEWAGNLRKVTKIDREKKEITFDYKDGSGRFDYHFVNVMEELDAPGEFYVDANSGTLYYYPPEELNNVNALNSANVEYDDFSSRFIDFVDSKQVLVQDLKFRCGRESFGMFKNCARCYIDGCAIEQFGGNALIINEGSLCGILNTRVRELGAGGIRISAGNRDTLEQCKHLVHNNFISDFGRVDRNYTPALSAYGCGIAVTNNLMCDSPHHGMRTDGNDMYVARNEIHSCVYEYSDQSGIDIYCDPSFRGIVIEKNLWRHIGSSFALCGQAGIRLDDSISGVVMLDNVFYRSSGGVFGGIQIHGGKDNLCKGNAFVNCKQAFSFSPWGEGRYDKFVKERFSEHVGKANYIKTYPFFDEIGEHFNRNYIISNDAINCGRFNLNGDGLEVFANNRTRESSLDLQSLGIHGAQPANVEEAFYSGDASSMRLWLEKLSGKSLSSVGLKSNWRGANVPVTPHYTEN